MIFISENEIKSLLNWNNALEVTEVALKATTAGKTVQPSRNFAQIFNSPKWMITMSGYLEDAEFGGWTCKVLTGNEENLNEPKMNANILFFDLNSGVLKAVLAANEITNWRTAAASAIATKYLNFSPSSSKILAIFGCGDLGKAHADCFYNCFEFEKILLWNRTFEKASTLALNLNEKYNSTKFEAHPDKEFCAKNADCIITATSPGSDPLIRYEWLKNRVHINAAGVPIKDSTNFELEKNVYEHATVYVDSWKGANQELTELKKFCGNMKAEIGEVLLKKVFAIESDESDQITIFQSLGMAAEDCAMSSLLYNLYKKKYKL